MIEGLPRSLRAWLLIALAAVAGVLAGLVWWPPIGVAAAAGSALLLVGAIVFPTRASDTAGETAPAVIGLGLAVATAILQLG